MISLKNKIQTDMTDAMRAQKSELLGAIRLLWAAIRQREIDERIELTDIQVLEVINKMIKQRRDSIEHYRTGNRPDLVAKEEAEIEVLQAYLPPALSEAEIVELIKMAIAESGAKDVKDIGKVMNIVKAKAQGRADISKISVEVKKLLQ